VAVPNLQGMGRFSKRSWVIGACILAAIAVVSTSAIAFQGRDDGAGSDSATTTSAARHRVAASTTTSSPPPTTTTWPSSSAAAIGALIDAQRLDAYLASLPAPTPPPPPPTDPPAPAPAPVEVVPPPPAPAPVCDGGGSGVIDAMNGDRAASGLGALCGSAALNGFAQGWANWMAQNQSLTHQDLGAVLGGTSFNTVAENILVGPGGMSTGQMEAAWMASPGHRANILNGGYVAAGVGIAYSSDGQVWVAVEFGG
jgi:uncharacterized protein YkwD